MYGLCHAVIFRAQEITEKWKKIPIVIDMGKQLMT